MTRISLAISVLIFFNPFTKLWERISDHPLTIRTSLMGLGLNLNIPFAGTFLLILYFILTWAGFAVLLWGLETFLLRLRKDNKLESSLRFFRNTILNAYWPGFIFWPEILARYIFWFFVGKFALVEIMRGLVTTALPGLISGWISSLIKLPVDLTGFIRSWIPTLMGSHLSQEQEIMLIVLSLLIIQVKRVHLFEKDLSHFDDIKTIQSKEPLPFEQVS